MSYKIHFAKPLPLYNFLKGQSRASHATRLLTKLHLQREKALIDIRDFRQLKPSCRDNSDLLTSTRELLFSLEALFASPFPFRLLYFGPAPTLRPSDHVAQFRVVSRRRQSHPQRRRRQTEVTCGAVAIIRTYMFQKIAKQIHPDGRFNSFRT